MGIESFHHHTLMRPTMYFTLQASLEIHKHNNGKHHCFRIDRFQNNIPHFLKGSLFNTNNPQHTIKDVLEGITEILRPCHMFLILHDPLQSSLPETTEFRIDLTKARPHNKRHIVFQTGHGEYQKSIPLPHSTFSLDSLLSIPLQQIQDKRFILKGIPQKIYPLTPSIHYDPITFYHQGQQDYGIMGLVSEHDKTYHYHINLNTVENSLLHHGDAEFERKTLRGLQQHFKNTHKAYHDLLKIAPFLIRNLKHTPVTHSFHDQSQISQTRHAT